MIHIIQMTGRYDSRIKNGLPTARGRADLHVHSKYSDRPSDWFLRRIGSPESFVEPLEIYRTAKARGMDFVTISDRNCINGALDIAHLPGVFLSNEATVYFPEYGCKVHILTSGISETQFRAASNCGKTSTVFANTSWMKTSFVRWPTSSSASTIG